MHRAYLWPPNTLAPSLAMCSSRALLLYQRRLFQAHLLMPISMRPGARSNSMNCLPFLLASKNCLLANASRSLQLPSRPSECTSRVHNRFCTIYIGRACCRVPSRSHRLFLVHQCSSFACLLLVVVGQVDRMADPAIGRSHRRRRKQACSWPRTWRSTMQPGNQRQGASLCSPLAFQPTRISPLAPSDRTSFPSCRRSSCSPAGCCAVSHAVPLAFYLAPADPARILPANNKALVPVMFTRSTSAPRSASCL